jgi:hypothetical protein
MTCAAVVHDTFSLNFKINESNISLIDLPKRIENPYLIFLEKEN